MFLLIGNIHAIIVLLLMLYPTIYQSKYMDKMFLITLCTILLLWTILKNECPISYLVKKSINPQYIMGERVHDYTDVKMAKKNSGVFAIFFDLLKCFGILIPISILMVNERNKLLSNYQIMILFIASLYTLVRKHIHSDKINLLISYLISSLLLCTIAQIY